MKKPTRRKVLQPLGGVWLHHTVPVLLRSILFASSSLHSDSRRRRKAAKEAERVRRSCRRMIQTLREFPTWIQGEFMRRTISRLEAMRVDATIRSGDFAPEGASRRTNQTEALEAFMEDPVLGKEAKHAMRINTILHSESRRGRPPKGLVGVRNANLWMLTEQLREAGVKHYWKVAAALLREREVFPSSFGAPGLRGLVKPFETKYRDRLDPLRGAFLDYLRQTFREYLDEELRALDPAFRSMTRRTWRGKFCNSCGARMLPEEVGGLCRLCQAEAPRGPKGFQ